MNKIFVTDKLPALLNILIGLFVYLASGLIPVESNVQSLTVRTYFCGSRTINDSVTEDVLSFLVTNSSSSIVRHHLQIGCTFPTLLSDVKGGAGLHKITAVQLITIAPAAPEDSLPVILENGQKARFTIDIMQPGNSFIFRVAIVHTQDYTKFPWLYVLNCDEPGQPAQLKEYGFADWCREYRFELKIALSLIAFSLILFYFHLLFRENKF